MLSDNAQWSKPRDQGELVHGVILCGGQSTRFGLDKTWVKFDNKPLIEHAIQTLQPQVDKLWMSTKTASTQLIALDVPIITDLPELNGPLAGIYTAMVHIQSAMASNAPTWLCTLPVDTLGIPAQFVHQLRNQAYSTKAQVVCVADDQKTQYALGLWNMQLQPILAKYVSQNKRSIGGLLNSVSHSLMPFSGKIHNINRPSDMPKHMS